jgi:hypothetical protein
VEFRVRVECSGQELTDCRNAWKSLPPLQPPPDQQQAAQGDAAASGPADPGMAPRQA